MLKLLKNGKIIKLFVCIFALLVSINLNSIAANYTNKMNDGISVGLGDDLGMDLDIGLGDPVDSLGGPVAPLPDEDDDSITGGMTEVTPDYSYGSDYVVFNGWIKYTCPTFVDNEIVEENEYYGDIYYSSILTNQNVTATLTGLDSGTVITNNNGSNEYVFEENGEFVFEVCDINLNTSEFIAVVDFINKETPTGIVSYEYNQDNVVVTLSSFSLEDKEIFVTNNDGSNVYTFIENGSFIFEFIDEYGNLGSTYVEVSSFVVEDEDSSQQNDESNNDQSDDDDDESKDEDEDDLLESQQNEDESNTLPEVTNDEFEDEDEDVVDEDVIVSSNESVFNPYSEDFLVIYLDTDFGDLLAVSFNGSLLDEDVYSISSDGSMLYILSSYLQSYGEGTYEVELVFEDTVLTSSVEIELDDSQKDDSQKDDTIVTPQTFDGLSFDYVCLLFGVCVLSIVGVYKIKLSELLNK